MFFYIILCLCVVISVPLFPTVVVLVKNGFNHRSCKSKRKLRGKTALVTGASAGIGRETAQDFAARGARVILACRNITKAQRVVDSIIGATGNKNVVIYKLDTSDMKSVRDCAREILKKEKRLDILVNNAGMGGKCPREITKDGLEITMATNYYGHFLLTNLLLGLLKKSAPSRIVNVSSELHLLCFSLDPNDLNFDKKYCSVFTTYAQSKLCNILFSLELSKKLKGTGVTANAVHPGLVSTEIFEKTSTFSSSYVKLVAYYFGRTAKLGAQTSIHVAVSEEVEEDITGKFFDNCQEASPSWKAQDTNMAKRLWEATVKDVKLAPYEIHY